MTGGEYLLRTLVAEGAPLGFGIPGALNAHLYDALPRLERKFRHILVRHELGGSWMADGFARTRNEVGVAFTVPGPGCTHATSALAGAYTECSRLLLITAQSERRFRGELRRDLFHGLDQERLFASITKWSAAVRRVGDLPEVLQAAFHHLRRDRPGPVHVEIPADVLGHAIDARLPESPTRPAARPPDGAALDRAAAWIRAARRPLLLAGDGVLHSGASEVLGKLAAAAGAPVITTVMGKGALDELHPWSLGDANSAPGSQAYGMHDLMVAVGVRFVQVDTRWPWFRPPTRLIHVDADRREFDRVFPADIAVHADPGAAMEGLLSRLAADGPTANDWRHDFPELKRRSDRRDADPWIAALRRSLPDETRVSWDVCVAGFLSRKDWLCRGPYSSFYPGVFVGMGFGLPIGIGAALADPARPVCVVSGDGGFQMTMAELGTAVQSGISLLVVVMNDRGLSLIRRVQDRDFGGRRVEVDLVNPDFCALAAAYGVPSRRVGDPAGLETAVRGLAGTGVRLIEVALA